MGATLWSARGKRANSPSRPSLNATMYSRCVLYMGLLDTMYIIVHSTTKFLALNDTQLQGLCSLHSNDKMVEIISQYWVVNNKTTHVEMTIFQPIIMHLFGTFWTFVVVDYNKIQRVQMRFTSTWNPLACILPSTIIVLSKVNNGHFLETRQSDWVKTCPHKVQHLWQGISFDPNINKKWSLTVMN